MTIDSQSNWVQVEPLKEVCIDNEDVKNIIDFFRHFEIKMPDDLTEALKAFEEAQVRNAPDGELCLLQNTLRTALCRCIVERNADAFKNEIFNEVVENCKKVIFIDSFENQVKDLVTT